MHVNNIDWQVIPFRGERFFEVWRPALDRALAHGARACYMTRDEDNPLHFRQVSVWDDKAEFEAYWASDEVAALREAALAYFHKPLIPTWHTLVAEAALDRSASA